MTRRSCASTPRGRCVDSQRVKRRSRPLTPDLIKRRTFRCQRPRLQSSILARVSGSSETYEPTKVSPTPLFVYVGLKAITQTRRSEWINSARRAASAVLVLLIGCASGSDPAAPPPPITPAAATDTIRTTDLAPGVRHTYRWEKAGPWAILTQGSGSSRMIPRSGTNATQAMRHCICTRDNRTPAAERAARYTTRPAPNPARLYPAGI